MHSNRFDQVFSFSQLLACQGLFPHKTPGTIVTRFPDPQQPTKRRASCVVTAQYRSRDACPWPPCYYYGVVVCHDYQTIESVALRLHTDTDVFARLLAAPLLPGLCCLSAIPTVTLVIDLTLGDDYIVRACRLTNLSWCRRLWALASRADLIAFTGVYYGVLGGAYSSLSKANASYAYKAGSLAIQQIKLAQWLKDPILESKCWLYFAEDLIQLRRFKRADKIIARQVRFAETLQDRVLLMMCESVLAKRLSAGGCTAT